THWDEPPRARHQLAKALAKNHEVIFVSANKIGLPRIHKTNIYTNFDVIIPKFPIDVRIRTKIPLMNKWYQNWLFKKIRNQHQNYIVINFDFTATNLFCYFEKVIYYCNDDFTAMSRNYHPFIYRYHLKTEKSVSSKSEFCIATSSFLAEKLSVHNKKTFEIRLGGPDIRDYSVSPTYIHPDKNHIKAVLLGFLSTALSGILEEIMKQPKIKLTFIGPVDEKYQKKYNSENIIYKGILTGNELYQELQKADVGIIPYSFTTSVDRTPNKLWQYFAVGKPAVISDIKSIKSWVFPDKFMYKSKNIDEFISNIFLAAKENNEQLTQARVKESLENTWEKRSEQLIRILSEHHLN
ncbi:MAG: glycosyltransferase family 4 protein, partial [Bacteroidales bacterium]|nr:glycosyltransferase family 4 protein [Bacteroidales bacterium]